MRHDEVWPPSGDAWRMLIESAQQRVEGLGAATSVISSHKIDSSRKSIVIV